MDVNHVVCKNINENIMACDLTSILNLIPYYYFKVYNLGIWLLAPLNKKLNKWSGLVVSFYVGVPNKKNTLGRLENCPIVL